MSSLPQLPPGHRYDVREGEGHLVLVVVGGPHGERSLPFAGAETLAIAADRLSTAAWSIYRGGAVDDAALIGLQHL